MRLQRQIGKDCIWVQPCYYLGYSRVLPEYREIHRSTIAKACSTYCIDIHGTYISKSSIKSIC